jgi:hypothetical protein
MLNKCSTKITPPRRKLRVTVICNRITSHLFNDCINILWLRGNSWRVLVLQSETDKIEKKNKGLEREHPAIRRRQQ